MNGELEVVCPTCLSRPGDPCTQPTDDAQKPVSWFHASRAIEARKPKSEYRVR